MKKILFALLILLPSWVFSQDIVGVWRKEHDTELAIEFTANGTINLLDLQNPKSAVLRNLTVTYKLKSENGINSLVQSFYRDGVLIKEEVIKYKIIDGKLYLPRTTETNGHVTVEEYKDEYVRIK